MVESLDEAEQALNSEEEEAAIVEETIFDDISQVMTQEEVTDPAFKLDRVSS